MILFDQVTYWLLIIQMLLVTLYCIWPFNKNNIFYLHSSIKCTSSFLNVKKWNEKRRILHQKCNFFNIYTFENQVLSHGIDFLKVILNIIFSKYFMVCNQNNVCVNVVCRPTVCLISQHTVQKKTMGLNKSIGPTYEL